MMKQDTIASDKLTLVLLVVSLGVLLMSDTVTSLNIGKITFLKTVDTIGNCQRLAFTSGVSQHTCTCMHKITNL